MKIAPAFMSTALMSAVLGLALPGMAQAQEPAPAVAPASAGVPIAAMTALMTAQGLTVSPVQTEGEQRYVSVVDGPLRWVVFFQACEAEACSDLQFSLGASNAGITLDRVNEWNKNRRFVKAFYDPAAATQGATPTAAAQYDAFLNGGLGADQMSDHLAVWRSLALEFARFMAPQTAPATPAPAQ